MRQKGFSLVEMMISIVIGMIVVGASVTIFSGTMGVNASQMKYSKLNNELRTVMTRVTRDMRRAGYKNWVAALSDTATYPDLNKVNYMTGNAYAQDPNDIGTTSATITYDLDSAGAAALGANDSFGFTWASNKISTAAGDLTDPSVIRITSFSITPHNTFMQPCDGTAAVTVPVYEVNITGELASDSSVQRSIRETVRLRNSILSANTVTCP